jgi:hypothetical protein
VGILFKNSFDLPIFPTFAHKPENHGSLASVHHSQLVLI